MAISIVQQKGFPAWAAGSTMSVTLDGAITNGNGLALVYSAANPAHSISSVAQTGVTWTAADVSQNTNRNCSIWIVKNVSSANATCVITIAGSPSSPNGQSCTLVEIADTNDTNNWAISGDATAFNSTGTTASVTSDATADHETMYLVSARIGGDIATGPVGSPDAFTALTVVDGANRSKFAYAIVADSPASEQVDYTFATGAWGIVIVGITGASSGGGSPKNLPPDFFQSGAL